MTVATVHATPPTSAESMMGAAAQRLRAAADVALETPPPRHEDAAADADACLAALVSRLTELRDPALTWLTLTALAGAYPVSADVRLVLRASDLGGAFDVTTVLLELAGSAAGDVAGHRPARMVTDRVVVDVDMSARVDLHNGIQRVVREVVGAWWPERPVLLAAWTVSAGILRTLTDEETARVVQWGRDPRHGRNATAWESHTSDRESELVIPWGTTVVLAEVPLPDRCPRLAALAELSGNRVALIGYDAIPFVSAELRPFGEPDAFAAYFTVVKHAHRVVAISASAEDEFAGYVEAVAAQGLTGPDVTRLLPPAAVPSPPEGERRAHLTRPLVVMVGRLEPHKNHLLVLAAAERLWRDGVRFDLRIIGGAGWDTARVERQLARLHRLGAAVTWQRGVGDDEMWRLLRDASFTVFVSVHEGFGLPVAESLACGTPVLTTRYGSQGEIASHGGCLTVDPRDDDAVLSGMRALLTDPDLLARLRAEAAGYPVRSWAAYAGDAWVALTSAPTQPRTS